MAKRVFTSIDQLNATRFNNAYMEALAEQAEKPITDEIKQSHRDCFRLSMFRSENSKININPKSGGIFYIPMPVENYVPVEALSLFGQETDSSLTYDIRNTLSGSMYDILSKELFYCPSFRGYDLRCHLTKIRDKDSAVEQFYQLSYYLFHGRMINYFLAPYIPHSTSNTTSYNRRTIGSRATKMVFKSSNGTDDLRTTGTLRMNGGIAGLVMMPKEMYYMHLHSYSMKTQEASSYDSTDQLYLDKMNYMDVISEKTCFYILSEKALLHHSVEVWQHQLYQAFGIIFHMYVVKDALTFLNPKLKEYEMHSL